VLVVGAGGLGAPVLQYLSAAGVGRLAIMDDDVVNEDNLHRQILYGGHDLGKLKTIIAKQRLKVLNQLIEHEMINIRLTPKNAVNIISKYDLVIDATDNYSTRYLINDACLLLNKTWIFGSVSKYEGQLSVFNYQNGPNLKDIFPDVKDKKSITDPDETGLFGILPGIIGSFQANEAIKIITGIGHPLSGRLMLFNMLDNQSRFVDFAKNTANSEISKLKEEY
jgi:adenylyltransferase/sulfurtransferase